MARFETIAEEQAWQAEKAIEREAEEVVKKAAERLMIAKAKKRWAWASAQLALMADDPLMDIDEFFIRHPKISRKNKIFSENDLRVVFNKGGRIYIDEQRFFKMNKMRREDYVNHMEYVNGGRI